MPLSGLDISNWQTGLAIPSAADFCICKATEGTRFTDPTLEGFARQCLDAGKLFGFYHFARGFDADDEARHFRAQTKAYELIGIPVLDMEYEPADNWGKWAQKFVDRYHTMTGVYPLIYASASQLTRFAGYPLVKTCDLWIAGYPNEKVARQIGTEPPAFPYSVAPWSYAAIWQFTANGRVPGWSEAVDLDMAYMTREAWGKYANPDMQPTQAMELPALTSSSDRKTFTIDFGKFAIDVRMK